MSENISVMHDSPDQPGAHLHVNLPSPSKHIPLFLHGFGRQSFKSENSKLNEIKINISWMFKNM